MVQLSATMEQTRDTQLAQLYDVLGFRRVTARYDVLSTLHETGSRTFCRSRCHPAKQLHCRALSPKSAHLVAEM